MTAQERISDARLTQPCRPAVVNQPRASRNGGGGRWLSLVRRRGGVGAQQRSSLATATWDIRRRHVGSRRVRAESAAGRRAWRTFCYRPSFEALRKTTEARQRALCPGNTVNHIHRKFAPAVAYGARLRAALNAQFVPAPPRPARRLQFDLVTLAALVCVPALLLLDRLAPAHFAFHAFYLPPVAWLSARWGRAAGWGAALVTAGAWGAIELRYGAFDLPLTAWNSVVLWFALTWVAEVSWRLARVRATAGELARTDPLTQVSNSRAFREAVAHEIARCRRYGDGFAVAYIDVDHFKRLNDRLGHEAGDAALRHIGASLRANLRCIDTVARMGGDEFAVLLPQTNAERARSALDKWRHQLAETADRHAGPVTVSIGIAAFEQPPEGVTEVIRTADAVMYAVKHAGRDGIATVSEVSALPPATSGAARPAGQPVPMAPADSGTTARRASPSESSASVAPGRPEVRPLKQRSRGKRRVPARKWLLTGKQM